MSNLQYKSTVAKNWVYPKWTNQFDFWVPNNRRNADIVITA